jgi:uncharacterized membrane protein YsdA (DUF1294 family)
MVGELERLDIATVVVGAISILAGVAGVIVTRAWIRRPTTTNGKSYLFWSLGIVAVLPAWLVLFVYLIPSGLGGRTHVSGAVLWLCSTTLGLTGAITSEARLRHYQRSPEGLSPGRAWSLGLWAMMPAWVAMLLGLIVAVLAG